MLNIVTKYSFSFLELVNDKQEDDMPSTSRELATTDVMQAPVMEDNANDSHGVIPELLDHDFEETGTYMYRPIGPQNVY